MSQIDLQKYFPQPTIYPTIIVLPFELENPKGEQTDHISAIINMNPLYLP